MWVAVALVDTDINGCRIQTDANYGSPKEEFISSMSQ